MKHWFFACCTEHPLGWKVTGETVMGTYISPPLCIFANLPALHSHVTFSSCLAFMVNIDSEFYWKLCSRVEWLQRITEGRIDLCSQKVVCIWWRREFCTFFGVLVILRDGHMEKFLERPFIAFFEHLRKNILEDFFLQWLPKCLCFRHWKWFEYVPFLVLLLKTKLLGKQQVPKWAESSA